MALSKEGRQRLALAAALLWAFLVTVARSWRWPNDWTEAHWLVSYDFGFLKRGLPGTLVQPLFWLADPESVIRLVSTAIFALFCLALLWLVWRIWLGAAFSPGGLALAVLLVTSPYLVLNAHLNGYYDHIVFLLAFLAALLALRDRVWAAAVLLSIAVLIHETVLLVGYGSVLFVVALRAAGPAGSPAGRQGLAPLIRSLFPLIALPLLTFIVLFAYQAAFLQPFAMNERLAQHLGQFDFIQGDRYIIVPTAFTASFRTFIIAERRWFWRRLLRPDLLLPFSVSLALMWACTARILRRFAYRRWLLPGAVAISLAPLSMHILAIDTARIWAYPLVVAASTVWLALEAGPAKPLAGEKDWLVLALLAAAAMQMLYGPRLLDGASERFTLVWRLLLYAPALAVIVWWLLRRLQSGEPGRDRPD